ncbi:MAG: ABC transporter permease subunit/CPBP intramembrane protease [Isosphaeraceae bacterium]
MNWSNLMVIFRREVLDQLRDRRTLFMIFVFPILLYPLLGFGVLRVVAAMERSPRVVVVVGVEHLPPDSRLLNAEGDGFEPRLFDSPSEADLLRVEGQSAEGPWGDPRRREAAIRDGLAAAVMVIPRDLPAQFEKKRDAEIPILYRSVDEPSQMTYLRLREVLDRWKRGIVEARTKADKLPEGYTQPIQVRGLDVATDQELGGSVWSKIFPFLLVMMSLTGAFYPAVDLCAGEKERGTMETLLISPATRAEIVVGKYLTVFLASVLTAVLNLVSMGLTGIVMAQGGRSFALQPTQGTAAIAMSPPSLQSAVWIIVLLIPLAAFFSAVCLALAVLARSMKEGQYYMTPLYLICLPLIFLTLVPEIKLNLFYSLVPVTGVALLLRALIMGDYQLGLQYFLPVLVPTVVYAWVALRWAIEQFQSEEVLFREAERFNLKDWLRHLYRDRRPLPTGGEAVLCFSLMLTASWFLLQYVAFRRIEGGLGMILAGQLVLIVPPVIMAAALTSSPRRTLRLTWPEPRYFALAVGFVVALNPLVNQLRWLVERWFPISSLIKQSVEQLMSQSPSLPVAIAVFALLPAVCEEIAFRGFILSGLQDRRRNRSAVVLSALMFGFLHVLLSVFQQLFNATLLGVVLGMLAIRSGSLLPCILFHFLNNSFALVQSSWIRLLEDVGAARWIYRNPADGLYHGPWLILSLVVSAALLVYLQKLGRKGRETLAADGAPLE